MKSKRWLILATALALVVAGISLRSLLSKAQRTFVTGRVVSAKTKAPVPDVMVAVESILSEVETHGSFVRTDGNGQFVAEIQGDYVVVRAWKPMYLMKGLTTKDASSTLMTTPITIELQEIEYPNLAVAHADAYTAKSGAAYSLAQGKLVERNSDEADITITLNPEDQTKRSVIIESQGDGGLIYQSETEAYIFATALEAPADGYQRRVVKHFVPQASEGWFLFVRARDGKHYAKLGLGINEVLQPDGSFYVSFDGPITFSCNYQPDGSRNLASNPTKYSFPFSQFGFDPNSLNP
jgi:hypothetical protein